MTKKVFLFMGLCIALSSLFTACNKSEDKEEKIIQGECFKMDAERTYKVKKGATISKIDTVYIMNNDGTYSPYRTLKIRNLNWTIIQEWLLDDLHTDVFDYVARAGDETGTTYGYYYDWDQFPELQEGIGGSWDNLVFSDADGSTPATGFHIPYESTTLSSKDGEIENLASLLGSTSLIRSKIQVVYEPLVMLGSNYVGHATFWIDLRKCNWTGNIVPNCGVLAKWDVNDNDHYWVSFTNIPDLKCNVRLVRTITKSQW